MTHRARFRAAAFGILAALFALPASSLAATFDARTVGSEAKFVGFVDLDRARETAVGQRLIKLIAENPQYHEIEARLVEAIGFMPLNDIHDLTLWGDQHGQDAAGVLVVHAEIDAYSFRQILGFTPDFHTDTYNGHEVLDWRDENRPGKRVHACVFDHRTVVFSSEADQLEHGIDVLDDDSKSLPSDSAMPRPAPDGDGWAFVSAVNVNEISPAAARSPIFGRVSDGLFELGETKDAQTTLRLTTHGIDEQAGERLTRIARNAQTLIDTDSPPAAPPATSQPAGTLERARAVVAAMGPRLLKMVTITGEGRTTTLSLSVANERAIDTIQRIVAMREAELDAQPAP